MKALIGGAVRAALAAAAGLLLSKGIVDEEGGKQLVACTDTITAGAMFAATVGWSWYSKRKAVPK